MMYFYILYELCEVNKLSCVVVFVPVPEALSSRARG